MVYVLMISKSQLHAIVEYIAMILIIVLILGLTSPNIPSLSLEHLQRIFHQRIHTTNRIHLSCTSPHTYLITLSPPPPLPNQHQPMPATHSILTSTQTTDHAY